MTYGSILAIEQKAYNKQLNDRENTMVNDGMVHKQLATFYFIIALHCFMRSKNGQPIVEILDVDL